MLIINLYRSRPCSNWIDNDTLIGLVSLRREIQFLTIENDIVVELFSASKCIDRIESVVDLFRFEDELLMTVIFLRTLLLFKVTSLKFFFSDLSVNSHVLKFTKAKKIFPLVSENQIKWKFPAMPSSIRDKLKNVLFVS